jgi:hypothetical protein
MGKHGKTEILKHEKKRKNYALQQSKESKCM